MWKYIFRRYRKQIIVAAVIVLLPIVAYLLCYGFIFFSYNYAPESIADTFWSLKHPPNVYLFVDQGLAYKELTDDLILRTDIVIDPHGRRGRCEFIGVNTAFGAYYFDAMQFAMEIPADAVPGAADASLELFYLEAEGHPLLIYLSDQPIGADTALPKLSYYRSGRFVNYFMTETLKSDEVLTVGNVNWTVQALAQLSQQYAVYRDSQ